MRLRLAVQLQNDLANEINSFLEKPPYEARYVHDDSTGEGVAVLSPNRQTDAAWSLRVSEILHHFRAALDNAVWELSSAPDRTTAFPLVSEPDYWSEGNPPGKRRVRSVPDLPRTVIKNAQPFHAADPQRSALWVLGQLSDIDKHRLLHTTAIATSVPETTVRTASGRVLHTTTPDPDRVFTGKTELLRVRPSQGEKAELHLKGSISAHVSFDEAVRAEVPTVGCLDVALVTGTIGEEVLSLLRALRCAALVP